MQDHGEGGFGLYVHWPFCQSKCPYCDFNSHVTAHVDQRRWLRAFESELDRAAEETQRKVLQSIFFGGGTPSLMEPWLVAGIIERVRRNWRLTNDPEITLEANPGSVEAGRFGAYRDAGVNRVSIGVQALDDAALRFLGRTHGVKEAVRAIEIAQDTFERASFDLIYARQGQTLDAWKQELRVALGLGTLHLSLYQLTIEEGTVFHERNRRGLLHGLPDEDVSADMYLATQEICEAAGLPSYEVSNHARTGEESRHNLIYWRGGDYLGVGPGAHGRLALAGGRTATEAIRAPGGWLDAVETRGNGELPRAVLSPQEHAAEYLMMGLRTAEGVSVARLEGILGATIPQGSWADVESMGLVEVRDGQLRATTQGRMVLNSILREILAAMDL